MSIRAEVSQEAFYNRLRSLEGNDVFIDTNLRAYKKDGLYLALLGLLSYIIDVYPDFNMKTIDIQLAEYLVANKKYDSEEHHELVQRVFRSVIQNTLDVYERMKVDGLNFLPGDPEIRCDFDEIAFKKVGKQRHIALLKKGKVVDFGSISESLDAVDGRIFALSKTVLGKGCERKGVRLVRDVSTGQEFAMKIALPHELKVYEALKGCPHMVQKAGLRRSSGKIHVVEQRYEMTLDKLFEQDFDQMDVIRQVLEGLSEMHARKVDDLPMFHKDIKPENILVNVNGRVDIAFTDFGKSTGSGSYGGSIAYMSNEALNVGCRKREDLVPRIGQKHDVWSAGILIINILKKDAQALPSIATAFHQNRLVTQEEIDSDLANAKVNIQVPESWSQDQFDQFWQNVVCPMLTVKHRERIKAKDAFVAFQKCAKINT